MYVKVLYDTKAKKGLHSGHGFSCLVGGKILFDTGGTSHSLVENMDRMMVKAEDLEGIVISHDHWDHTSGLWELLRRKKGLKVYACPSISNEFKQCVKELGGELILADKYTKILKDVYVTGGIKGEHKGEEIYEQALIVKGDNGVSVITGCAHPGIVDMLKFAKRKARVKDLYMAFGGFHLDGKDREEIKGIVSDLKNAGLKKAGPTHCSGEKARRVFSGEYHGDCIPIKAGHIIHL